MVDMQFVYLILQYTLLAPPAPAALACCSDTCQSWAARRKQRCFETVKRFICWPLYVYFLKLNLTYFCTIFLFRNTFLLPHYYFRSPQFIWVFAKIASPCKKFNVRFKYIYLQYYYYIYSNYLVWQSQIDSRILI